MLRLDLQFYAFLTVVLCGAVLGLLFDLLRAARGYYRPNRWIAAIADVLFWVVATISLTSGMFYANWAEFRLYVLVGILLGVGVYFWLASPVMIHLVRGLFSLLAWVVRFLVTVLRQVVWAPLLLLANLVWASVRILYTVLSRVGRVVLRIFAWLLHPFYRWYRFAKLHYLLTKRRWRRRFRR